MFSFLKKVNEYYNASAENKKRQKEKDLQDTLAKLEDSDEEPEQNVEFKIVNSPIPKNCFKKTGRITSIEENTAVIDGVYAFDEKISKNCFNELEIGLKVSYLAYQHSEDIPLKIVRVEEIVTEIWDGTKLQQKTEDATTDLQEQAPEYFDEMPRTISGHVSEKNNKNLTVYIGYQNVTFNLDEVASEFLAQIGDKCYLDCRVQKDDNFLDSNGEILRVLCLRPTKTYSDEGRITLFKDGHGVISNKYLFYSDVLKAGYKRPTVGDKVRFTSIETIDKAAFDMMFDARCINIEPLVLKENEMNQMNNAMAELEIDSTLSRNKNGVIISEDLSFSFSDIGNKSDGLAKELIIENTSATIQKLIGVSIRCQKKLSQFKVLSPSTNDKFDLQPGEKLCYKIAARPRFHGAHNESMVFAFVDVNDSQKFTIGRNLKIIVEDVEHVYPSQGTGPVFKNRQYTAEVANSHRRQRDVIGGVRTCKTPNFIDNKIASYNVPDNIKQAVLRFNTDAEIDENLDRCYKFFSNGLLPTNYEVTFRALLHLEEIQFFHNIRQYDLDRGHFRKEEEFLALYIDNIAERRPSLVIGDSVRATNPWMGGSNCYEGIIHKVKNNRILLKFNQNFHEHYNGEDYKLEFCFSRSNFRKQHHAIHLANTSLGSNYFFPSKIDLKAPHLNVEVRSSDLQMIDKDTDRIYPWFNPNLNLIQKEAVRNVVRGEARPTPYIIFGPPGTGKTMTLIEIILQLAKSSSNNRLLVATPSNSAANLITERLIDGGVLHAGDFIRIVSYNLIEKELISAKMAPYCATVEIASERTVNEKNMIITESGLRLKCQLSFLGQNRVTISTCASLGALLHLGFKPNHFTHAIVDEAGQCVEPETAIPISFMSKEGGHVILAGDPMQLGPVVLSKHAVHRGLGKSMLVRLLERVPYQKDNERFLEGYDPRLVTKLRINYRSLKSILSCYSDLFYDSELESMVSDTGSREREILDKVRGIFMCEDANPRCGLFVIGTNGVEKQLVDSPSWCNPTEANQIHLVLCKLYKLGMNIDDIGIITPYQQQVKVIRSILEDAGLAAPKIGSVEEFQGQERQIILISTVRSRNSRQINKDIAYSLGFVRSPMRLNVAISRARAVLVIIGNPTLLACDSNWCHLLKEAIRNKTYTGCDAPIHLVQAVADADENA